MFLEMQIFAFRDRLRILPKTSRGIFFKILDFSSMFYTDFVHRNDFQCKKINNMFWKCNFFIENYKLIILKFFWNMTWPWKLPLRVHHDLSKFCVTNHPSYKPSNLRTHPLIESLSHRLKSQKSPLRYFKLHLITAVLFSYREERLSVG